MKYVTLPAVDPLLNKLIEAIKPLFSNSDDEQQPLIVGIDSGGVWVAEAIHRAISPKTQLGRLNISFYRDDFSRIGLHPTVKPSVLPEPIDDRRIILVDDVLYSGRTVRAAMNELFDFGRPSQIMLAILIDRGEREIPIQPDFVGETMQLMKGQHIKLTGPEPLSLSMRAE
ncbi:MAG: pyrimidine operon attenuation protein/uracil phosphoribosyltransferase [Gammaproteobacteria bacterium]